ncbi:MAG: homoserine O-acetyltransferase [Saprospiraceae bacterium]|nr:homoserine O-acetyltransferase [Saprospiraceae bacterium]
MMGKIIKEDQEYILPADAHIHIVTDAFELESGVQISNLRIAYNMYGSPNAKRDNVIWVFHALTANSEVVDWWAGLFGEDKTIDPEQYCIICANVLGSYYGSTGARSINPETEETYGLDFPRFTVRDVVRVHHILRSYLKIEEIFLCIGGSFGGHQALEFALESTVPIQHLCLLACSARETAWSIAIHESQRMAMESDPSFYENHAKAGETGIKTARAIGLLSYRTIEAYIRTQTNKDVVLDDFRASSYVRYQGEKLARRFHAHCYWLLSKCLDTHHIGRGRNANDDIAEVLATIQIPTLVIGIDSDMLIPPSEQRFIAQHITNAQYKEISSAFGHDGFLIETEKIANLLKEFCLKS